MRKSLVAGVIGGAVGTLALDVVSYGDMLVQGRAASELPGRAAAHLTGRVGWDLEGDETDEGANRRSALGALLGYATGVAVGCAYSLGRTRFDRRWPVAGMEVGALALVLANGPMVALGLTDPRTWGVRGWASDLAPHVAYGLATVATVHAVAS